MVLQIIMDQVGLASGEANAKRSHKGRDQKAPKGKVSERRKANRDPQGTHKTRGENDPGKPESKIPTKREEPEHRGKGRQGTQARPKRRGGSRRTNHRTDPPRRHTTRRERRSPPKATLGPERVGVCVCLSLC